jgi:hypothetical protein
MFIRNRHLRIGFSLKRLAPKLGNSLFEASKSQWILGGRARVKQEAPRRSDSSAGVVDLRSCDNTWIHRSPVCIASFLLCSPAKRLVSLIFDRTPLKCGSAAVMIRSYVSRFTLPSSRLDCSNRSAAAATDGAELKGVVDTSGQSLEQDRARAGYRWTVEGRIDTRPPAPP